MHQVLFTIPLSSLNEGLPDLPIYGYGMMLFVAFIFTLWLAVRLARREGIRREVLENLAIWLFLTGIIGARVTYLIQYQEGFSLYNFFAIWTGGLIFYGSMFGGLAGFILAYFFYLKPRGISGLRLVDVIAPCIALGLCLGRIGCLLNGCCYGNVACTHCPEVGFPLAAAAPYTMTQRGHQSIAGFTLDEKKKPAAYVAAVDPTSPAAQVLQPGDKIVAIHLDGQKVEILNTGTLDEILNGRTKEWPRGKNDLQLTVERAGQSEEVPLPAYTPYSIGLHPTQVYETISMGLMTFLLLAYYPFKRRDGMVLVVLMAGYAVHRYLNEMLRTDTPPVAFGLTLSQNISVGILILTAIFYLIIRLGPTRAPLNEEPDGNRLVPRMS